MKDVVKISSKGEATATAKEHGSFESLCKELGTALNYVENTLLCYRAYLSFKTERGVRAKDRDSSFSSEAARLAVCSVSKINAMLQVGKMVIALPEKTRMALIDVNAKCPIPTGDLAKLATKEHKGVRVKLLNAYCENASGAVGKAREALHAAVTPAKPNPREEIARIDATLDTPSVPAEKAPPSFMIDDSEYTDATVQLEAGDIEVLNFSEGFTLAIEMTEIKDGKATFEVRVKATS